MKFVNKQLFKPNRLPLIGIFAYHWIEFITLIWFYLHNQNKKTKPRQLFTRPIIVLSALTLYSVINCFILGYGIQKTLQQAGLLTIFLYLYSLFFSVHGQNLHRLFEYYLKASYFIAILGLLQVAVYFVIQKDFLFMFTWFNSSFISNGKILRLHSICPEGGQLGTILNPCIVYAFYFNDKYYILKRKKYVILAAALLTTAMTTMVTLAAILYFKFISRNKYFDIMMALFLVLGGLVFMLPFINSVSRNTYSQSGIDGIIMRIQDTSNILMSLDDIDEIEKTNTSTYTLAANFYVAYNAPDRFFGTGLGTHDQNYDKVYPYSNAYSYGLNKYDGYSLFNRIFSEFGIVGLVLYVFFVFKGLDRKDVISFSLFFYLLSAFMRGGHYVMSGVVFFHYFITLSKLQYQQNKHIETKI